MSRTWGDRLVTAVPPHSSLAANGVGSAWSPPDLLAEAGLYLGGAVLPHHRAAHQRRRDLTLKRATDERVDRPARLEVRRLECPRAVKVDQHQVGIGAWLEHALARIQSK